MQANQLTWKRVQDGIGGHEYRASNGARVYAYPRRPFQAQEWGVQMPTDRQGSGGFLSMREARSFVERHAG